jgi:hypothetical protein
MSDEPPSSKELREYQCLLCQGTFTAGNDEEEAKAECIRVFGRWDPTWPIVCDECYQQMIELEPPTKEYVQ